MASLTREMEARLQDLGTFLSPLHHSSNDDNDVIVLGSSPPPEVTIKVRRRGKIFRINVRPVSRGDLLAVNGVNSASCITRDSP